MLRFLAAIAAGGVTASALGAPADLRDPLVRPSSIGYKHGVYNFATGKVEPMGGVADRLDPIIWQSQDTTGYYLRLDNCGRPGENTELALDWGDMLRAHVTGCQIGYATNAPTDPNAIGLLWAFGDNSNGFGDNEPAFVAGFYWHLPGVSAGYPYQFIGWMVTFDFTNYPQFQFDLGDEDLDGDGLADFGYCYTILDYGRSTRTGPLVSEPNDPLAGPGAEDAFDLYVQDPNHLCANPDAPFFLDGTYSFGGPPNPFAQLHMVLYGNAEFDCPDPGCEAGDLDSDCVVGLADLSDLLDAFGCDNGDACYDPGDDIDGGGIGTSDLSALLTQYGNNCN